jgi:hypothetical protein
MFTFYLYHVANQIHGLQDQLPEQPILLVLLHLPVTSQRSAQM